VAGSSDSLNEGLSFQFTPHGVSNGPSRLFEMALVSASQQMVTGMARYFTATGMSSRFKLNSGPSFPPEIKKKKKKGS
jgi:hypothetical protein